MGTAPVLFFVIVSTGTSKANGMSGSLSDPRRRTLRVRQRPSTPYGPACSFPLLFALAITGVMGYLAMQLASG